MEVPSFRELYEQLMDYEGSSPYKEVLVPWQREADQAMSVLKGYGDIEARHLHGDDTVEGLWGLYALSRVSDLLLLPFQQGDNENTWRGPDIEAEERNQYFTSLGLRPVEQKIFHPFFHEIVEVLQSPDPAEPISLDTVLWSGFMLGALMFCRAGVRVRGGRDYIRKEVAERSTLYFTHRRKNRPVLDPSHGWGSNSQWRTEFRRDYEDATSFYYNVDGRKDACRLSRNEVADSDGRDLMPEERVELVVHRCFIRSERPHEDLWPFDDTYSEKKTQRSDS